jgi:hypothetical protein
MADTMAVPFVGSGYGAVELKQVYQKYMSIGLVASTIMMFSARFFAERLSSAAIRRSSARRSSRPRTRTSGPGPCDL